MLNEIISWLYSTDWFDAKCSQCIVYIVYNSKSIQIQIIENENAESHVNQTLSILYAQFIASKSTKKHTLTEKWMSKTWFVNIFWFHFGVFFVCRLIRFFPFNCLLFRDFPFLFFWCSTSFFFHVQWEEMALMVGKLASWQPFTKMNINFI